MHIENHNLFGGVWILGGSWTASEGIRNCLKVLLMPLGCMLGAALKHPGVSSAVFEAILGNLRPYRGHLEPFWTLELFAAPSRSKG